MSTKASANNRVGRRIFAQASCVLVLAGCTGSLREPDDAGLRNDAAAMDGALPLGDARVLDAPGPDAVSPVATGWGEGTDPGSIAGDLWTPGRDSAGVVNAVSIATLEPMRFYEVADSRLDGLEAEIRRMYPDWRDTGVSRWDGVTDAWVGMAYDSRAGLERAWIGPGGGHAASSNNGLYRHDLRVMRWSIQDMPSPSSIFPAGYQGDTSYPTASAAWEANPTGPIFYDEIFDPAAPEDPVRSSRRPTSRHTYQSLAYAPDLGAQGSLLMGCRRQWRYDIAEARWHVPLNMMGVANAAEFTSAENMTGWWDEVRRRYYHSGNNASTSGDDRNYWWSPETGEWGNDEIFPAYGWATAGGAAEKLGRTLYFLRYGVVGERTGLPGEMVALNLDTGSATRTPVLPGTTFEGSTFPGARDGGGWNGWDTAGMTFIEPLGRWLIVVKTAERGEEWAWLDVSTGVFERATDLAGLTGPIVRLENKIKYFPDARLLVWYGSGTRNIRVMRI